MKTSLLKKTLKIKINTLTIFQNSFVIFEQNMPTKVVSNFLFDIVESFSKQVLKNINFVKELKVLAFKFPSTLKVLNSYKTLKTYLNNLRGMLLNKSVFLIKVKFLFFSKTIKPILETTTLIKQFDILIF